MNVTLGMSSTMITEPVQVCCELIHDLTSCINYCLRDYMFGIIF